MTVNRHKVDNAIILAAGYSSRFVPLCFDIPKGLLFVKGETLIERQIKQLLEININEIHVITGAYKEQFEFLKDKYNINLIHNNDYSVKNNFASIYAAKDVLGNSIITSSDLYFTKNIFQNSAEHSYYASVYINGKTNQRSLFLDENDKIVGTKYSGENTWITFGGQAFLTKELSHKLINYIEKVYDDPAFANKYWVDFQDEHLEDLPMYIKRLNIADIIEFNTLESLRKFDTNFKSINISKTMKFICEYLNTTEEHLRDFIPIKNVNSAIGCEFMFNNSHYKYLDLDKKIYKIA